MENKEFICNLSNDKIEIATHWVGKTGNEYPINEYMNWGGGKIEKGKKDLPMDEYPYKIKYKTDYRWLFCRLCKCSKK